MRSVGEIRHALETSFEALNDGRAGEAVHAVSELITDLRQRPSDWRLLAEALLLQGSCFGELGDLPAAEQSISGGLKLHERNLQGAPAPFFHELSIIALKQKQIDEAYGFASAAVRAYLQVALSVARSGFVRYAEWDLVPASASLIQLAVSGQEKGDNRHAIQALEFSSVIAERAGDLRILGVALNELGLSLFGTGRYGPSIGALVASISVKLKAGGFGLKTSMENLRRCIAENPELLHDPVIQSHLLTLKTLISK